jgi:LPS sulfotransferase NodH
MVNFMKRKGGRPAKINFEQLTANPNAAVVDYLKREIKA